MKQKERAQDKVARSRAVIELLVLTAIFVARKCVLSISWEETLSIKRDLRPVAQQRGS